MTWESAWRWRARWGGSFYRWLADAAQTSKKPALESPGKGREGGQQESDERHPEAGTLSHPPAVDARPCPLPSDRTAWRLSCTRAQGMSWMWRRKTPRWQQHLDRLLDVVLAVLGTVLLAEVILLLT
jgi:hypothetical protein